MRKIRSLVIVLTVAALLLGRPVSGRAETQGEDVGYSLGAAGLNLFYLPLKVLVAGGGLVLGAVAGVLTLGDTRSAYALWVPAAGGTYVLRPEHLAGAERVEFFGSDYADTPSTMSADEMNGLYEAGYH